MTLELPSAPNALRPQRSAGQAIWTNRWRMRNFVAENGVRWYSIGRFLRAHCKDDVTGEYPISSANNQAAHSIEFAQPGHCCRR